MTGLDFAFALFLVLVVPASIGYERWLVPRIEARLAAKREARATCETNGHRWGRLFHVNGDPSLPAQKCEVCGTDNHLKRCTVCRRDVDLLTRKIVEDPSCFVDPSSSATGADGPESIPTPPPSQDTDASAPDSPSDTP